MGIDYEEVGTDPGVFRLFGVPSNINQDTLYSYTIVAVNQTTQCISNQISGSFNVLRGHELKRLSSPSTETQIICEGDLLTQQFVMSLAEGQTMFKFLDCQMGLTMKLFQEQILSKLVELTQT